ncbi:MULTISPECIES: hemolysin XhlA family protein [Lysinibacillus]|uniref:hemolysin XhlA family protein n=1 Tax=Lysinibacillus TaxID=400634 RepID=UPI00214B88FE|nr:MULTISPECIES: hemolysin XhlA family protein [Lysinibacillus]UUV27541.1 hemolysin XhlA family protein [Lysinibacillus sp. FN11]UYB49882.1 hemolysin XhlA family protein [Lysinibacillus capsici]WDU81922.1 hemolysin XhlA family protein [Lysinibacillus sp. G01H]WHP43737.1 hemolysin XhlA family protein [Lysinibacillus boronitolerans]
MASASAFVWAPSAVAESNIKEIREDIGGIKDNTTWILRLVIGGLVGALLTFIIKGGMI